MIDHSELAEIFSEQAEWRERKAQEFPEDKRNLEAAVLLRHLATTSKEVPVELLQAAEELYEDLPDLEEWSEMLRQVGFHTSPANAEEFLRRFVAARTS